MKPVVRLIKKADREAPGSEAEIESEPNRWSRAVRSWVSEFQDDEGGQSLPAFDGLFQDALP